MVREHGNPDDRLVLRENDDEQAIIAMIRKYYEDGVSIHLIARKLADDGVTKRGKMWNAGMIERITSKYKRRRRY